MILYQSVSSVLALSRADLRTDAVKTHPRTSHSGCTRTHEGVVNYRTGFCVDRKELFAQLRGVSSLVERTRPIVIPSFDEIEDVLVSGLPCLSVGLDLLIA